VNIHFERMRKEHIPEILAIERASFPTPWSEYSFRWELNDEKSHFLVAILNGHVVGYCGFWLIAGEAHIANIAVHPNLRRRGIGRALLMNALRWACQRGAKFATLEVRRSNTAAQRLYESFGFEVVGVRRKYYEGREDALIMTLNMQNLMEVLK